MFSRFFKRNRAEEEAQVSDDATTPDASAAQVPGDDVPSAGTLEEATGSTVAPLEGDAPESADVPESAESPFAESSTPAESAIDTDQTPFDPFATQSLEAIQQSLEAEAQAFSEQETMLLPAGAAESAASAAAPDAGAAPVVPLEEQPPSDIDLGPDRRGGLWVWIGLIVGMLVAGGAIGYAWWYTTSRPIPVPAVIGRPSSQAVQQLNDVGLRLGRVQEEATDTAEVGEVIGQQPSPSTKLKPGDLVSLVVAGAPLTTEVPEVIGRTRDEAFSELADKNLSAKVVESFDATTAAGVVIAQIPSAGTDLRPGALIALVVSKGPATTQVRMPKLIGLKQTDAETLLKANGLRGTVFHSYNASITVGEIYAQAPLADTSVSADAWTHYLVSDGAGTRAATVPSVVGTTRKVAEQRLKDKGFKVTTKSSAHLSVPKGQVISQMPPANSKVAKKATVGIIVSRGSTDTTAVPDFNGKSSADVSATADASGISATIIEVPISGYTAGMVFGQWPSPGVQWRRRFPIMVVTARLP